MSGATGGNDVTEAVDVGALPPEQSPAVSEEAFLRLQKQRPLGVGTRRDGERPRPSDITVTEPPQRSVPAESASASLRQAAMTPRRSSSPFTGVASPGTFRTGSPRHLSPATSQIFERDVQEATLAPELSPAIPSHIQTEDHIPPVLEASSEVITNDRLNPDEVEIVTHTSHQPASAAVTGGGLADMTSSGIMSPSEASQSPPHDNEDSGATYATMDPTDPRRLSFISFADVVHAEHAETGKDTVSHLMNPSFAGTSISGPRSPSPARSPLVDRTGASPPRSGSASMQGAELSPSRGGPGSIASGHGQHGELTIETMRQTLQKTGSNDVGGTGTPG